MKKKRIIIISIIILSFFFVAIISSFIFYKVSLNSVDADASENIEFVVNSGDATSTIIANLKKEGLIKNELTLKIYSKLHEGTVQAGTYILTKAMSASEIYDSLISGKVSYNTVWVQFIEGKRVEYIAEQIAKNFDYTEEEVMSVIDDETFIKSMIEKYDVLTDDVLETGIYHPLEGYLFPDNYEFLKTASIENILETMIATLDAKVSPYKEEIENSSLSMHQIITLASMAELEGTSEDNRADVAGVFMNRLNNGWTTLGSDVTTYYGVGKDFSSDLTMSDLRNCNPYNTSSYGCRSGLPIGPIASVSISSLKAAINPSKHDYYYFVSDKNKKLYFSRTESEHAQTVANLKAQGLWYEY